MLQRDILLILTCGIILLLFIFLFWKEFKILSFDLEFAQTIGLNIKKLDLLLNFSIVVTIIIGLQTVGVILMSAMLISPAVGARQWVNRLSTMVFLSAIFGGISGIFGTALSSSITGMPTGPAIILCSTTIALFSLLFAPNRGVLYKIIQRQVNRQKIPKER